MRLLIAIAVVAVLSLRVLEPASAQTPAAMEARAAQLQQQPVSYGSSLEQYQSLQREARAHKARNARLPDWSGLWTRVNSAVAQHVRMPLRSDYAAQLAQLQQRARDGKDFDHLTLCLPAGYPRSNNEPFLKEFIVGSRQTWIIDEQLSETRRVYTDGRDHPAASDAYPLWEGHSIGFWNNGELVVHTTDAMGFPSGYARNGPPQSDQLSTVEEWRNIDQDLIEMVMTVYDPVVLSRPYRIVYQYKRVTDPALFIGMWACEDSNTIRAADGGTNLILPGEPGYQAPGSRR